MVRVLAGFFDDPVSGSRILLSRILRASGYPSADPEHDSNGKPFLAGGPEISLSHTRGAAAAAVSDGPVGVDLEAMRIVKPQVVRRVLSPEELHWYETRGSQTEDFLTLWTLKESFYKCLGTGLPGFPNGTCFREEDGLWRLPDRDERFHVRQKDLLFLAVCCMEQEVEISFV